MNSRVSVNHLCFPGTTLTQFAAHARELGTTHVSLVSPALIGADLAPLAGFQVETIAHMFQPGGPEKLSQAIGIAKQLGARSIYMLTGGHGTLEWEAAADAFCKAIAPCVKQARDAGVDLAIENALPLYADLHLAHSLRDTVALAEMADIGVCIDLFGCWTEADLRKTIERAMPRCRVIQVSDYVYADRSLPSRAVPGDGAIPLQRLLEWSLRAGYRGAFDLELIGPRIDKEGHVAATRRAADRVGEMLRTLGAS